MQFACCIAGELQLFILWPVIAHMGQVCGLVSECVGMGFAYLMALLTGFVFAGFVSSLWPLIARREVSFGLLFPASYLLPFEVLVVVFSAPLLLLKTGVRQLKTKRYVVLAWGAIFSAVFCGFFQGVAVLSFMYHIG